MKCKIYLSKYKNVFGFIVKTDSYYWLRHTNDDNVFTKSCYFNSYRNAVRYFKDRFKKKINLKNAIEVEIEYEVVWGTVFVTKVK